MDYVLVVVGATLVTILLFFAFLIYSGLFAKIQINVKKPTFSTEGTLFYKFYQKKYSECSAAFREIQSFPIRKSYPNLRCIGIYYDDPDKVPAHKTRYAVGLFIPRDIKCDELKETMAGVGYKNISLPDVDKAIITDFPLRNVFSILIAVYRVYPKLKHFFEINKLEGHPCLEIYGGDKITFLQPLEKNDRFYVEEFAQTPIYKD